MQTKIENKIAAVILLGVLAAQRETRLGLETVVQRILGTLHHKQEPLLMGTAKIMHDGAKELLSHPGAEDRIEQDFVKKSTDLMVANVKQHNPGISDDQLDTFRRRIGAQYTVIVDLERHNADLLANPLPTDSVDRKKQRAKVVDLGIDAQNRISTIVQAKPSLVKPNGP